MIFETDEGMTMMDIHADNMGELVRILKRDFPDDIGADGMVTDEQGNDHPLDW